MSDAIERRAAARRQRRLIYGVFVLIVVMIVGGVAAMRFMRHHAREYARDIAGRSVPDRPHAEANRALPLVRQSGPQDYRAAPPSLTAPEEPPPAPAPEPAPVQSAKLLTGGIVPARQVPSYPAPTPMPEPPAAPEVPAAKPDPVVVPDPPGLDKDGFPLAGGGRAPAAKGKTKKSDVDKRPSLGPKLDPLVDQLTGASGKGRMEAATKLGAMGPDAAPATPYLCVALIDPFPAVSVAALKAIETVAPGLYEPLAAVRLDESYESREIAVARIGTMGEHGRPVVPLMLTCVTAEAAGRPAPLPVGLAARAGHHGSSGLRFLAAVRATGCEAPATLKALRTFAGPTCKVPGIRLAALEHLRDWAADEPDRRAEVAPLVIAAFSDPTCQPTCFQIAAAYGPLCKPLLPTLRQLKLSADPAMRKLATDTIAAIEAAP